MNSAVTAAYGLTGLFWASWMLAAAWSRRTAVRPPVGSQTFYTVLVVVGFAMLFTNTSIATPLVWPFPWVMVVLVAAGYAFCWWARIHLGTLWSGTVTVKEGHHIIDTGPYRLVRHPIYTGLILASFGIAATKMDPAAFVGAALCTTSFWIKARMEEGFLRAELGPAEYDAYAARTPMLIPFGPK